MNLVEVKDFSFSYPECSHKVLEHVNLKIKEGTLNVICGRSGCGKSTLLRQLKTVLAPAGNTSGQILYRGVSLKDTDHRTQSQEIGFVMQMNRILHRGGNGLTRHNHLRKWGRWESGHHDTLRHLHESQHTMRHE